MADQRTVLRPYTLKAALLLAVPIWVFFALIVALARTYLRWPESGDLTTVTLIGMVIGLIPLFLSLIDYAAARRTVVELPFAKIDFSRADIKRGSVELPDNIGRPGPIISDSAPMEIV